MDHRQIYQKENSLTDLLRRSFVCCQDEKRSECMYSRVFSTMRTDKRSSKKRSNYFHFGIYILILCLMLQFDTSVAQSNLMVTDGPYIDRTDKGYMASWVINNKLKKKSFDKIANKSFAPLPFPITVREKETPIHDYHFEDVSKIAAISDLHGQYNVMIKLFKSNKIIDDNLAWNFGEGHLVITGDVLDRGDQVTEILWFLYQLEQQAEDAGGKVHMLLGNHELMVMTGDVRYIHKKYRYTTAVVKRMYQDLFGETSVLGNWLRTKPVSVTINGIAFLHAGFSKELLETGVTIDQVNTTFSKQLFDVPGGEILQDSTMIDLYADKGPLWYRGYLDMENFTKDDASDVLKTLGVEHVVVGHSSMQSIVSLFDNRIFMIDSSIKFGKTGEILLWEDSKFSRGTLLGETISIQAYKPAGS